MIVKHIGNNGTVFPVLRPEAVFGLRNYGVHIGKIIDLAVQYNAFLNAFRKLQDLLSAHGVGYKIPDQKFSFGAGKKDVREVVQVRFSVTIWVEISFKKLNENKQSSGIPVSIFQR